MNDKFFSFIGLMFKANRVIVGADKVLDGIKNKKVFLVILTDNTLTNTKKMILDKTKYYNIPIIIDVCALKLNHFIGKDNVKVIGITDTNVANKILNMQ